MGENILEVRNLTTSLNTERGRVTAVQGVSFHVEKGEILGLVGESGCGKSVTSQSIMRLYDEKRTAKYSGEILLDGENLLALPERDMRRIRGSRIAMVFQDSLSSLNPVFTCGEQIMESMRIHRGFTRAEARREAVDMLTIGDTMIADAVASIKEAVSDGTLDESLIDHAVTRILAWKYYKNMM